VSFSLRNPSPLAGNVQQYQDVNLAPGTTYYYKIQGINAAGTADSVIFAGTTAGVVTPAPTPTPAPVTPQPWTGTYTGGSLQFINGLAVK